MSVPPLNQHLENMKGMSPELVAGLASCEGLSTIPEPGRELSEVDIVIAGLPLLDRYVLASYGYASYILETKALPLPRRLRANACMAELIAVAKAATDLIAARERRYIPEMLATAT